MDKLSFKTLFETAVMRALEQAGKAATTGEPVVEFHGRKVPENPITMDEALDLLWLSLDQFHRIIDVGVIMGAVGSPLIFVRPSGHDPVPFAGTWKPSDLGPFIAIGPMTRGSGA